MKTIFALLALTVSAFAADLPMKAPTNALFTGYPYNGSGVYWGVSTLAQGENPTINGTVATSLQAFGGSLGGVVGYQWGHGNVAYAIEGAGYWQNLGGASVCSADVVCSVNSTFEIVERVKAITPLSNITGLIPSFGGVAQPALPALPSGITVANMHGYIFGAVHEAGFSMGTSGFSSSKIQTRFGFGVGTIAQLSNNAALDVWAEYQPASASFSVGSVGGVITANSGNKYVVGTSILW